MRRYRVSIGKWSVELDAIGPSYAASEGVSRYLLKRPDLTWKEVAPYVTVRLITGKKVPFQEGGKL